MRGTAETLGIGVIAAVLYFVLQQEALFSIDGANYYQLLRARSTTLGYHVFGLSIIRLVADFLGLFGLNLLQAASGACALLTALAAMVTHRTALRLLPDRSQSAAAAALFACLPTTLFFATLVELPGVFSLFCASAYYCAACYCARPSPAMAGLVGLVTAITTLVHATGQMLPMCVAAFVAGQLRGGRRLLVHGAVMVGVHALASILIAATITNFGHMRSAGEHLLGQLGRLGNLRGLGSVLLHVYTIPLLPASVVLVVGLCRRRTARAALWLSAPTLVILVFATLILAGIRENGRYFALITCPAAIVSAQILAATWRTLLAAGVGLLVGIALVRDHERANAPAYDRTEVEAVLDGAPALVVIADGTELLPMLSVDVDHHVVDLVNLLAFKWPLSGSAKFDLGWRIAAAQGKAVVITHRALARLRVLDPDLAAHLATRYRTAERSSARLTVHTVHAGAATAPCDGR